MIFMHKDYHLRLKPVTGVHNDNAADKVAASTNKLKLQIISGTNLIKEYTVSLDPSAPEYISKVLNTDSFSFESAGHLLYADFPVDSSLAQVSGGDVAIVRGKDSDHIGYYEDFAARFEAPKTPSFISQPFGRKEYDLFHFESLDDGSYASGAYKISIADLKASTEKNYKYGTFTVQLRQIDDTDDAPIILESYANCSLDPDSSNYIARLIGDQKVSLSLDVDEDNEKRLVREGSFPNKSTRVRVVMDKNVSRRECPDESLPFGFRGIPALRTTPDGKDGGQAQTPLVAGNHTGIDVSGGTNKLTSSVLPPLPFRSKITKGSMKNTSGSYFQSYFGQSKTGEQRTSRENVKTSLYWGLHTSKVKNIDKPNDAGVLDFNPLV